MRCILAALAIAACGFAFVGATGCVSSGSSYAVFYTATTAEARSALARKVKDEPVLRTVIYQPGPVRTGPLGSYQIDELILTCPADEHFSAAFKAKRKSIEAALGSDLLKMLKVASHSHPNF